MASTTNEPTQQTYDEDHDIEDEQPSENTPLLNRADSSPDQSQPHHERSAESLLRTLSNGSGKGNIWKRRWPSFLALAILSIVIVLILVFAFFAPSIVEQYAAQAVLFEPTSLSVAGFTDTGVRARIQGNFRLDASRVSKKSVRDLGRFGTWIARYAESGESEVEVSLPEYGNVVLGTAQVPRIKVDVRNGHTTHVDFLSELEPGSKDGIRRIANDWIDGRLGQLRVVGKAAVPIKSGLFSFGMQVLKKEMLFKNKDIPSIPGYEIKKLNFHEMESGMEADVTLAVENGYPVDFEVPSLGFQILVEGCLESDPYILVADAATDQVHILPKEDVEVDVTGVVRKLPNILTQDCPGSDRSPLDVFVGKYISGKKNTIYVRGARSPSDDTPKWIEDLITDIVVPVPLPGKTMGHLIRNFSLADTHFDLPDPFARPGTPTAKPRISTNIKALVDLPEEMNFNISANRVRADAEIFYKGEKLGTLDLHKWQQASSKRIEGTSDDPPGLLVESKVDRAPLDITDEEVFADVISELLLGSKAVVMSIKADVDVQVETALGEFKIRRIPAEGEVPVKPINSGHRIGAGFKPKISDLQIVNTSSSSLTITALVNLTNPTEYSASVPYADIHVLKNGSLLGHATAIDLRVKPGENSHLLIHVVYDPLGMGGKQGREVGREMLSQYISGYNTTLSLRTHAGTIPTHPALGAALSKFEIELPTPHLSVPQPPSDPADPPGSEKNETAVHFIKDATMHLITSTATFTLLSPLRHSTLFIEAINATALYKGDDVGRIEYDLPFAVPPVDREGNGITSPRLPVDWSLGSVGYEAVKNAIGGTLKLAAEADVSIRLGKFRETVWFKGKEIGAHVRL